MFRGGRTKILFSTKGNPRFSHPRTLHSLIYVWLAADLRHLEARQHPRVYPELVEVRVCRVYVTALVVAPDPRLVGARVQVLRHRPIRSAVEVRLDIEIAVIGVAHEVPLVIRIYVRRAVVVVVDAMTHEPELPAAEARVLALTGV